MIAVTRGPVYFLDHVAGWILELDRGKDPWKAAQRTTGLHTYDVHMLIEVLQQLTSQGNTVVVIEHNLDVIKCADHIVDLGPEGGDRGGTIVATGTPEEIAAVPQSYTGQYLKPLLAKD